jgi:hypothetical protein
VRAARRTGVAAVAALGLGLALTDGGAAQGKGVRFVDVTAASKIAFRHTSGAFGKKYLPETMGSGVVFLDFDGDDRQDVFFVNSTKWPGQAGAPGYPALYRNNGDGTFADVTKAAGLAAESYGLGAAAADYDNDGRADLYLTCLGRNRLYRNLGGGRFEDVTDKVGLTDEQWAGDAGPIDVNRDGWTDLYVISMQGNDEYFENQQGKRFVPKRAEVFPKTPWGTMGIKVFDFDNDGNMDIFLTDMHSDMSQVIGPSREKEKAEMKFDESLLQTGGMSIFGNAFFRGKGDGTFEEVSDQINAENYWPWGPSVGDLNADGYEDAFVASSMNYPFRYGVNTVLLNDRGRRFLDSEFILGIEPRRDGKTATPWFEFDCAKDEPSGFTKPIM